MLCFRAFGGLDKVRKLSDLDNSFGCHLFEFRIQESKSFWRKSVWFPVVPWIYFSSSIALVRNFANVRVTPAYSLDEDIVIVQQLFVLREDRKTALGKI